MNKMSIWPRVLVALAAIMLSGALVLPIWRIELEAPQYPEGLALQIYANALAGDVDVINGLNHYIGMKTLHTEDFIEFTLLPYIIGAFVALGLLAALINKKGFYYTYIVAFILFGIVSMVDFYRWNYNYGHDLDPHAAIRVPGMAYQPPLIGYKQLLNFGAYSIPDTGGWLFIGAGVILLAVFFMLLKPKWFSFLTKGKVVALLITVFLFQSCSTGPKPIKYGQDACDFCKMTIIDKRFAAEWVTSKGKAFKFDDLHCLAGYRKKDNSEGTTYINSYSGDEELKPADNMMYLQSETLKSPMGGNIAAFHNQSSLDSIKQTHTGKELKWTEVLAQF